MKKILGFFKNVFKEMKTVRWPNRKEMVTYSIATLFCIVIFAVFFTAIDAVIAGIRLLVR